MTYSEFVKNAARPDASNNDKTHFFSSIFSLPLAFVCYRARLSPNGVTLLFLVVGVFASVSLYFEQAIVGYILWRLHIILDMADGSVARATKIFSSHAEGFDKSNHIIINTSVLVAVSHHSGSFFMTNLLIISFLLQYNFSRNFDKHSAGTFNLPGWASVLRHMLGIEGLILIYCSAIYMNLEGVTNYLGYFYVVTFSFLFAIKLYKRIHNAD